MLTISSTIRRTATQDGTVLLDIESGQMYRLNSVGSKILELIAAGCDQREITDRISALCRADIDVVEADVRAFLDSLSRNHILGQGEPGTARGGRRGL